MRTQIALLLLLVTISPGQDVRSKLRPAGKDAIREEVRRPELEGDQGARELFRSVERAIATENIGLLSSSFGKQVSMTISGNESGLFSSSQALAILRKYFSTRKPTQFSFTRLNDSVTHPYATGRLDFVVRGNKESVQVYVSLSRQDALWVISQFNIY